MALKSAQPDGDKVDIEEALDYIDKALDRTKVLYEQYFLGMQKQPPAQLHTDVERRLRELHQHNIRNTGMRYRFATLQQKFGSYNSYWRRTLRQIENGTYIRNLAKISRQAALTGEEVPEEILAAMPKRMREQVKRDREQALATKARRAAENAVDVNLNDFDDGEAAVINSSPPKITRPPPMQKGTHQLGTDDGDFDIEAFFATVTNEKAATKPTMAMFDEPRDEDTQPNAEIPQPVHSMAIAGVAATAALGPKPAPKAVPRAIEDEPSTGVHEQRAPRPVEDEPTGVVTPVVRALPGLPTRQASNPGVTNLAAPRGTATPAPGTPNTRPPTATPVPGTPIAGARPPSTPGQPIAGARPPSTPGQPIAGARPPSPPDQPMATSPRPSTNPGQPPRTPASPGTQTIPRAVMEQTQPIARPPTPPPSPQSQAIPPPTSNPSATDAKTQAMPVVPPTRPAMPAVPRPPAGATPAIPKPPIPAPARTQVMPVAPTARTQAMPVVPMPPKPGDATPKPVGASNAPSQQSRPIPIVPGASSNRQPIPVQSMQGPFEPTPVAQKPRPVMPKPPSEQPAQRPPPGMNQADVNALYAKYVKAKEMVGEDAGPGAYSKLMKTINAQAPKIMEQYKAKGVEFSVVVKDNQVIIKAKPKT
ncbi:MAG: MXAN_5187 C-terminal domain-containing protein [Kofleriaceae bacterium]